MIAILREIHVEQQHFYVTFPNADIYVLGLTDLLVLSIYYNENLTKTIKNNNHFWVYVTSKLL